MYQYAYDDVTDFEICRFKKKTQKSRYLENETFFFQIKKSLITHKRLLHCFVAETTFNTGNRRLNLKNALCTLCSVFLFNIFSGYLHYDTLIIDALITGSLRFA